MTKCNVNVTVRAARSTEASQGVLLQEFSTSVFDSSRCVSKLVLANTDCSLAMKNWQYTATNQMLRPKKEKKRKAERIGVLLLQEALRILDRRTTGVCTGALAGFAS